jgi:hypothetical protein
MAHTRTDTDADAADPDILAGNTSLRSIEVIDLNSEMIYTLMTFGSLYHLTALKTISLHFNSGLDDSPLSTLSWRQLDVILAEAGSSLVGVHIYAFANKRRKTLPDVADVRSWLPSVAGLISVHIPTQIR